MEGLQPEGEQAFLTKDEPKVAPKRPLEAPFPHRYLQILAFGRSDPDDGLSKQTMSCAAGVFQIPAYYRLILR